MTAVYAVSDAHGHVDVLTHALSSAGLTDAGGHWAGRDARLWVLGDFFDRGPDGIAVADLVRRLEQESDGAVRAVLGNHEVLAVGMRLFGDAEVSASPRRSFAASWMRNGGRDGDQERLDEERVSWLRGLPAAAIDADHLLVHSDTLGYLEWGGSVQEINAATRAQLAGGDLTGWWNAWQRLTDRHAFLGDDGPETADRILETLGAERIVHGHSIVAELRRCSYADVQEPWAYAEGRALAVDGGVYEGGPCLVARIA